ncbi:MAG TPA: PA domain-containing protein [Thermoanaerobaculia bacterium]|nr:PA domain-containing protein [Thermoanaerobaculia bacterium]
MSRWLLPRCSAFLASLLFAAASPARAATIVIVNVDPAGSGLNDPTPLSPVGGNTGTTLGAQRLIVFQEAARIWGALLPSNVTITVRTSFASLPCTDTEAVLGSAGPTNIFSGFPNAPVANTWYVQALANKLANAAQDPDNDISARFNADLGTTCAFPSKFYLGLDNNHGQDENLLTVVLHELGHGLGFYSVTNANGAFQANRPSIFERNLFGLALGKSFDEMTGAERGASLVDFGNVVWTGDNAINYALANLVRGRLRFSVTAPAAAARNYEFGTASFGPMPDTVAITGQIVAATGPAVAGVPTTDGCQITNASTVAGKIALVDRGTCNFTVKVKNAQNAGAVAAIVADNKDESIFDMGGTDATITIPAISVTQSDGVTLRANLPAAGFLGSDPSQFAGGDAAGRLFMYTPSVYSSGSSLAHWDTSAFPNLLMEPNISRDLPISVDATLPMLRDIGWFLGSTAIPTTYVLPSSAHAPGKNGAFYSTDLTITNAGTADATFTLKFLGHDQDGMAGPEVAGTLLAGHTVTYTDVLGSLFGIGSSGGFGAIRINADSNQLRMVSQTSTPPPSGVGTFGQAVTAQSGNDVVTTAAPKVLFPLRQDGAFRTNVVIANTTEAPAHVDLRLFTSAGTSLGSGAYDLAPLEMRQVGEVVKAIGGPGADGTSNAILQVSTPTANARIATYAAVIDQTTNDPRTVLPVTLGTLGANTSWLLPSSAHGPGKNNAFYTTDLTIANTDSTPASVTLKFLGHERDGRTGAEAVRTIPGDGSIALSDVLGSVFGVSNDYGSILVTPTTANVKVVSQTSTPPPDGKGTFGQSVPAFGAADFVRLAAPRALVGLREDAAFRTNAVLANATDQPAHVDLTLKSEAGATIGTGSYDLLPYEMRQIGTVITTLGGPGLQGTANAALWVSTTTTGARIATYAAVIDNITNDPRTILP